MSSLRHADIVSGLVCTCFGSAMISQALKIENLFDEPLPPGTLPLSLSIIVLTLGLFLAFRAWRYTGEDVEVVWPAPDGWLNILVTIAALSALYLLMPILGLPISAFLFTTGLIWFYDRKLTFALPVGLGIGLLLHYIFIKFLQMPYPLGILE